MNNCFTCHFNVYHFIVHILDKLVASIEAELKRLQRRKMSSTDEGMPRSPQSAMVCSSGQSSLCSSSSKDQPLFTLKHVTMVCQRMIKEKEEQIRREYDDLLAAKLAGLRDLTLSLSLSLSLC